MCPTQSTVHAVPNPEAVSVIPDFVPKDVISQSAYSHAATYLHPSILNHSLRVYLLARSLSAAPAVPESEQDPHHSVLLFTACILHDIGTSAHHDTGPLRFEIEAADFASQHLTTHGVSATSAHDVWIAIALHSTPQIAERITPLSRLVRLAVTIDFKNVTTMPLIDANVIADVEREFPRGDIERVLGDAVVEQAVRRPEKAPKASWPGGLYQSFLENPDWKGVSKAF